MKAPAFRFCPAEFLGWSGPYRVPPAFMLNAKDFIVRTLHLSPTELGEMMWEINRALEASDIRALRSYPFIGRIFRGSCRRPHIPLEVQRRVLAAGKCSTCGSPEDLQIDHVIPFSKGGAHHESNFQPLCRRCNREKSNK